MERKKPSKRSLDAPRSKQPLTAADIMTTDLVIAVPITPIREVAQMMAEKDCGAIPILENNQNRIPKGIITDRDIVCRLVAGETDLRDKRAQDAMSGPVICVPLEAALQECASAMKESQIKRVLVVDERKACRGILSLADLIEHLSSEETAELINDICEPTKPASREDSRLDVTHPERRTIALGDPTHPSVSF